MSINMDSKEEKAKELMKKCSDQFSECPVISTLEILSIINNKDIDNANSVTLVDVRSVAERRVSMIQFAISVQDFEIDLKKNPELYKNKLIVPYCTIGYRSGKYGSELMKNYGCSNVRNGEGIVLWTYSGTDLIHTNSKGVITPANKVHTFGSIWDLSASKYTSVQFGYFDFIYEGLRSLFGL
mmetsp:Transcript_17883/g.17207  ORF Transcript_17883/g.17207 Transcript_17883/m.17207 type:complete len:183 (-) Transcript_17883:695-1243(-)